MKIRNMGAIFLGAFVFFPAGPAAETPAPIADEIVVLPNYAVTAERELPPPEKWRYAEIAGFEVLSNASDRATKRFLRDLEEFHTAMTVVWPAMTKWNVPVKLILCGKGGKFDTFVPKAGTSVDAGAASLNLHDREQSAIVIDLESNELNLLTQESLADAATTAAEAPSGDDSDAVSATGGGVPGGFLIDHYKEMKREYVHFLLARVEPRPPAWLEEGLAQIFMTMEVTRKQITFAKVEDPNVLTISEANAAAGMGEVVQEDRDFNKALERRALMELDKFFAVTHESPEARNTLGSTWAKQAQGLVHMWLYGRKGKYQKGFVTFVMRSAREPVTEALFKECFGMDYRAMLLAFRGYIGAPQHEEFIYRAGDGGLTPPPEVTMRDATESEVGRIKGEVLMLAGKTDAARLTMITPYQRGERDPRLLASLGLMERAAGDNERARSFLEAVAAKTTRPRALLELARMRYDEAIASAATTDGKISAAQTASVLRPLFAARMQPPAMFEIYDLMADAWLACAVPPKRDNLAVFKEGISIFPRDTQLAFNAAQLNARNGFNDDAARFIEIGLAYAGDDDALKDRLVKLKATLPPSVLAAPAPAASPTATPAPASEKP